MKKILTLSLASILLLADTSDIKLDENTTCHLVQVNNSGLTGDISGKVIFTHQKYVYKCIQKKEIRGKCKEWQETKQDFNSTPTTTLDISSIDKTFQGSVGGLMNMIGAVGQIEFLFSGWKGYCVEGISMDFSWLQDPYMYASFAATYAFSPSGAEGATASGLKGKALMYAKCATAAGINTAETIQDYYKNDPIGCNPVDEICDDKEQSSEEQTYTLTRTQYNDMVAKYQDIAKYLKIIKEDGDVLLVSVSVPKESSNVNQTAADAKKAMEDLKKKILIVRSVITTASLATCLMSGGKAGGTATSTGGDSPTSIANLSKTSVNLLPVDPMTKIGLTLAINFITSFKAVDSCHKEKDAREQGSRHQKTFSNKKYGMCHFINKECIDGNGQLATFGAGLTFQGGSNPVTAGIDGLGANSCSLYAEHYCCYDTQLTRILVEQIKAQLARGWNNCSDFSLKEVTAVKFRQCTQEEMNSAPNGINMAYDASFNERKKAFQYKYKCIDLTEYKKMLSNQVGQNINVDEIFDNLNDLKPKENNN